MERYVFEENINVLLSNYEDVGNFSDFDSLEEIVTLFEAYLKESPDDEETLVSYAIFLSENIHDEPMAVQVLLNFIKSGKSSSLKTLIVLAEINFMWGPTNEEILQLIDQAQTSDEKIMSMIEYVKTYVYRDLELEKEKAFLIRSVELCGDHVSNLQSLAGFCYAEGKLKESIALLRRVLRNIRGVGPNINNYVKGLLHISTADDYINEFITGTNIPEWRFEDLGRQYLCYKTEAEKASNNKR